MFKLFQKSKKEFSPGISSIKNFFSSRMFGQANDHVKNYTGWQYRCIKMIADEVATTELRLYKKSKVKGKNDEEIFDHEILTLLNNPNPEMTKAELFKFISSFLDIDGNAYFLKAGNGKLPQELWPLRSDSVKPVASTDKIRLIGGYNYWNGEKNVGLETTEVIHFKEFNPKFYSELKGTGAIEAAEELIDEYTTISEWNKKFFKNGAIPSGVLEYDGNLTDPQKKRVEAGWRKSQEGAENAGKTPILSGGLHYKQTQFSQKDLGFIDQRKLDRDEIFAMLGVPKGLMLGEDGSLANAKTLLWAFTRFTIKGRLKLIEDILNSKLVSPAFPEFYVKYDNPVPQDRVEQVSEYAQSVNVWRTPNEIRDEEGLPAIEGGDELRQQQPSISTITEPDNTVTDPAPTKGVGVKKKTLTNAERDEKGMKAWGEMIKKQTPYEDKYRGEVKKYFNALRTRVIQEAQSMKSIKKSVQIIDNEKEVKAVFDLLTPLQRELWNKVGKAALIQLGLENDFVVTPSMEQVFEKYNLKLAQTITETTRVDLQNILEDTSELGMVKVTENINAYFAFADEVRAERIARSETIRTANSAMADAWQQSGVVEAKEWFTAFDERTCDYCGSMDGTQVGLDGNFFNKGDEYMGLTMDFRDIGEPPLHTNCRCVLMPVLIDNA